LSSDPDDNFLIYEYPFTMLSPAETVGLLGSTLDNRVRKAVHRVGDGTLARISDRLRIDAQANAVVYERDGVEEPVRIMLRPLLAMPEQLSYVDHVCLKLAEALKRMPALYLEDEQVRRILAITPEEDQWLRDIWTPQHHHLNPLYGRLDAVCDFTSAAWQESLLFLEPNLSGVGGIHYAPLAEELVMRDVVPTLLAQDPELDIELPRDQRELFLQVLIDHARAIGRKSVHVCLVEPKYSHDGPNEQSFLKQHLSEHHGMTIVHADPRELRVEGDEVYYEDVQIDVAYRDYAILDLVALEREIGKPLDAMRLLFRQNRIVSSMVGDFDHKSCWELMTDESIASRLFTAEERRLFRRHVLWTRIVADRRTVLPHGKEGSLLDFARKNRERLVLKPNRGYGGKGVVLGSSIEQAEWDQLITDAAVTFDDPVKSWVLQSVARLPVHEFPVVGPGGTVFEEPFYSVMGFATTENGLGILCRVSQKQVVNVAQHGGLAVVLTARPPRELKMPRRTPVRTEGAEQILRLRISELLHLDQTIGLLSWDEETKMPPMGRIQRGEQLATLEGLRHRTLTADDLGDFVEEVAQQREDDAHWMRELTLLRHLRRQSLAVSEELVRDLAKAKSRSLGAWEDAYATNDFALFAPAFEKLLELVRERAVTLARGDDPYDTLLNDYERGMSRSRLDPVLADLKLKLVPLVEKLSATTAANADLLKGRSFHEAGQWDLCRRILKAVGFDFERGRLDRSTHPFTAQMGSHDVRLTIRVREDDLPSAVLTTLHEGGHGLYDQGFMPTDRDSFLGEAPSMGLHESQSRLWENHIGRSRSFWDRWLPTIQAIFPEATAGLSGETFFQVVTAVRQGTNRVNSDEVSYHLHILLRYELERQLISGDLSVHDLPNAWNEQSRLLLGYIPKTDRDGVLQDSHWAVGMFGYFPSYTIGSLYAAQLAEAYQTAHGLTGDLDGSEFQHLLAWLHSNVHQIGHRMPAEDIIRKATGSGLDSAAFFRHIARTGR
jgi:carboxypeptidase Taq